MLFECNYFDASLLESYLILDYNSIENGFNAVYSRVLNDVNILEAEDLLQTIKDETYILSLKEPPYKDRHQIICTDDGNIFASAEECRSFYDICSASRVNDVCKGFRATVTNRCFRYLDADGKIIEPDTKVHKKNVSVYCVEEGIIFDSIAYAISELGLLANSKSAISKAANGISKTAYGYHWRLVDGDEIQEDKFKSKRKAKQVIVDDRLIFETVAEAIEYFDLPKGARGAISQCCRGKSSNAYGHTWNYMKDGVVQETDFVFSAIDRSKVKRFEIICDDEIKFKSLREAIDYFGLSRSCNVNIAKVCRGELDSAYGHKWRYGNQLSHKLP